MCPHHPFPKSHGNPKSMNKLTLNEPAKTGQRSASPGPLLGSANAWCNADRVL